MELRPNVSVKLYYSDCFGFFFFLHLPFYFKGGNELFQGCFFFSLYLLQTLKLTSRREAAAKTEFPSKISMLITFPLKLYCFVIHEQHSCAFTMPFTSLLDELGC